MIQEVTLMIIKILSFLLFLILLILWYQNDRKKIKPPKRTNLHLPAKIEFQRTIDNESTVKNLMLNLVTIGGHERLKEARYDYETEYEKYAFHFNNSISIRRTINDGLNDIGIATYKILKELQKSQKILNRPAYSGASQSIVTQFDDVTDYIYNFKDSVDNQANSGVILLQGAAIGGLAAVGSWTLVSMFGAASTGTAIASLSGIAAHNAILAWFGGGALAVGGGGMAAGATTLGLIFAAPIVILSSYKTHTSANELENKVGGLISAHLEVKSQNEKLKEVNLLIREQLKILNTQLTKIEQINEKVSNLLYPNGVFSKTKRTIDDFFDKDFYTQYEIQEIEKLLKLIDEVQSLFDNQSRQTNPLLTFKNNINKDSP